VPLRSADIIADAGWAQNSLTVAGGNNQGDGLNQLNRPCGIFVDNDQTLYIVDRYNHRIMKWKCGDTTGQVIAGANGKGDGDNQLCLPTDVIVDRKSDSLIICDAENRRVVRWPCRGSPNGETIISNVDCFGLTMDDIGFLYISDDIKNEVRRWRIGESHGIVVAGGNGKGVSLNQFNRPTYLFVDRDYSLYVSDHINHRIMKWKHGAKEGIVVAGGHGFGNDLSQLSYPRGLILDQMNTIYVADFENHRIMRWLNGVIQGNVLVGGNSSGRQSNQINCPNGLSFDQQGNLYVVDCDNNRVLKFDLDSHSCH
jgi:sugar lactone lactonase YvrE